MVYNVVFRRESKILDRALFEAKSRSNLRPNTQNLPITKRYTISVIAASNKK